MSRLYTPTDQTGTVDVNISGADSHTTTDEPTNDLIDRKVSDVSVTITGSTLVEGEGDGVGSTATARIEYESTPGGAWVTVPGSEVTGTSVGSYGPTTANGPWTVTLPDAIDNLTKVAIRSWGSATTSSGGASATTTALITGWTVTASLKGGGILAA